jgi:diaminopimelate epimerase
VNVRAERTLDVVKMHGAENAFVLIDERAGAIGDYPERARTLCAPGGDLGGADGILLVRDAPGFAGEMAIFNADGSEAEMCGNGVRCVARYLYERGAGDRFAVKTLAGPIGVEIVSCEPAFAVRVDIGPVSFPRGGVAESLYALGSAWTFYDVSLGNPHAVIFADDPFAPDLDALGRAFAAETDRFPHGTNVHLVQVAGPDAIVVRHFERGVGLTRACGTGAVASAAAARRFRGVRTPTTVRVPGGTLIVEWAPGGTARLMGPAETLFARTISL